ncbi:hypothetical protein D1872_116960 [compost metagenome]
MRSPAPSPGRTLARSFGFLRVAASHQAGSSTCQPLSSRRWLSVVRNCHAASSESGRFSTSSRLPARCPAGKIEVKPSSHPAERSRTCAVQASGHEPDAYPSSASCTDTSNAGSCLSCNTSLSCQDGSSSSSSGSSSCRSGRKGAVSAFQPMAMSQARASRPAAAGRLEAKRIGYSLRKSAASASVPYQR